MGMSVLTDTLSLMLWHDVPHLAKLLSATKSKRYIEMDWEDLNQAMEAWSPRLFWMLWGETAVKEIQVPFPSSQSWHVLKNMKCPFQPHSSFKAHAISYCCLKAIAGSSPQLMPTMEEVPFSIHLWLPFWTSLEWRSWSPSVDVLWTFLHTHHWENTWCLKFLMLWLLTAIPWVQISHIEPGDTLPLLFL